MRKAIPYSLQSVTGATAIAVFSNDERDNTVRVINPPYDQPQRPEQFNSKVRVNVLLILTFVVESEPILAESIKS